MSYDLVFEEHDGILRVEANGDRTTDDPAKLAEATWRRITAACKEHGLKKILVISKVTGNFPTMSIYEICTSLLDYGIERNWKIAFVNLDPDSKIDLHFAETVAVNNGIPYLLFDNEKEALEWLAL